MSKLEDFLGLSDVSEIRKELTVDINGKKLSLTVRPITENEHNEYVKRCNVIKGNKVTFDSGKYNNLVLSDCIVEPNFNNVEFLAKAKCHNAEEFLNKKFPSGVLANISSEIQKLSGFESYEMEIENAKN